MNEASGSNQSSSNIDMQMVKEQINKLEEAVEDTLDSSLIEIKNFS